MLVIGDFIISYEMMGLKLMWNNKTCKTKRLNNFMKQVEPEKPTQCNFA